MFRKINNGFCVVGVSVLLILFMWGCDPSGGKPKGTSDRAEAPGIAFVERSGGLPETGQWRQGLAFHDMNGDGHVDILATPRRAGPIGETAVPVIFHGNGKGEWSRGELDVPRNLPYDYGAIAVADFDGDGIQDVALGMHGLGIKVLRGEEGGPFVDFSKGIPPKAEFASRTLIATDLNNDGIADIAGLEEYLDMGKSMNNPYGGILWCTLEGKTWRCQGIGGKDDTSGLLGDQIVVGDVNNDGNRDLAVSSFNHRNNNIVWLGDGEGGFKAFNTGLMKDKHYNSVAFADVNGDGLDDLVASISGFEGDFMGVKAYISGPDGFLDMSEGIPSGEESWEYFAAAGDLDGDGIAEIISAPQAGGLRVYFMKEDKWHEMKTSGLPEKGLYRIYNIYCTDIDQDGRNDIVVIYADANDDSGGIRVFLNASPKK